MATPSLACQLFGERGGPYSSRRHDTSFHTEDRQSKWPTFRWLSVGFISCLSLFRIASSVQQGYSPYHTRTMALSGLPPHMLHPQTDLPQLDFIVIPWATQLLPKSSLVISVLIQVPIVLCFSWEVMNKCLFTLDRALMTDPTSNFTLVWLSE